MHALELTRRLAELLHRERAALGEFLVALADFDRQRGWLELGHSSLFYFLHRELRLSKGAAYHRKVAAALLQEFPEVLEPLRDGRLCISGLVELSKVITPENRADVLPRFFHCSKREAMAVSAEIAPKAAPHRVMITAAAPAALLQARQVHPGEATLTPAADAVETHSRVEHAFLTADAAQTLRGGFATSGVGVGADGPAVHPDELARVAGATGRGQPISPALLESVACLPSRGGDPGREPARAHLAPPPAWPPARGDVAEPLTADLRRLHVTVTRRFIEKLEAARDALSHARPGGSVEEVLESALDLLLQQHAKKKGLVAKPRTNAATKRRTKGDADHRTNGDTKLQPNSGTGSDARKLKPRPSGSEHIPAAVKREVWTRDRGCCQWPLESGGVCGSTLRVEFDHVTPRARGGPSTVENLRLLCRAHNQIAARRAFGDDLMDRVTAAARSRSRSARDAPQHAARGAPQHAARGAPGASGRGVAQAMFDAAAMGRPASRGGSHEVAAPVHDANGG